MTAPIRRAPLPRLDIPGLSRVLGSAADSQQSRLRLAACCACGILISLLIYGPALLLAWNGINDFIPMYAGAKLCFTDDLYNASRVLAVEEQSAHWSSRNMLFCRLPYAALLLWGLGNLSYRAAYYIWQAFSIAALVGFIRLWPLADRRTTLLACCWSVPVFTILAEGQDVSFVMLSMAGAWVLLQKDRPFAAGAIFALCALKFHLFLLLPLWVVANRLGRFAAGLLSGGAALLALSFVAGGWGWPAAYLRLLADPGTNPGAVIMPNLHGIFYRMPWAGWLELLSAVCVALAVWVAVRRAGLECGFAATIAGGILVSHHAFVADCAVLVPALLMAAATSPAPWQRVIAVFLLTPAATVLMFLGPPIVIVRAALVVLVLGMALYPAPNKFTYLFPRDSPVRC